MKSMKKLGLRSDVSLLVEDGMFTLSVQALSVSSGPCRSKHEAFNAVFQAIHEWEAIITSETGAATLPVLQTSSPCREVGNTACAPVLRRLLDKFGSMTNRELKETLGLTTVDLTVFSSSLAGRGSRKARVVIASALEELPSQLWPFLSEKTRTADDEGYLSVITESQSGLR